MFEQEREKHKESRQTSLINLKIGIRRSGNNYSILSIWAGAGTGRARRTLRLSRRLSPLRSGFFSLDVWLWSPRDAKVHWLLPISPIMGLDQTSSICRCHSRLWYTHHLPYVLSVRPSLVPRAKGFCATWPLICGGVVLRLSNALLLANCPPAPGALWAAPWATPEAAHIVAVGCLYLSPAPVQRCPARGRASLTGPVLSGAAGFWGLVWLIWLSGGPVSAPPSVPLPTGRLLTPYTYSATFRSAPWASGGHHVPHLASGPERLACSWPKPVVVSLADAGGVVLPQDVLHGPPSGPTPLYPSSLTYAAQICSSRHPY